VDLRAGLDDLEKRKFLTPPGLELRPVGRPALSQSLYRLRYPGSSNGIVVGEMALGQIFSELYDYPCQLAFYSLLQGRP
jgi:hypothetical protein